MAEQRQVDHFHLHGKISQPDRKLHNCSRNHHLSSIDYDCNHQVGSEWQRELETLAFRLQARLDSINQTNRFSDENHDDDDRDFSDADRQ